ncbi:unnamed protein product [Blepharisma stoltei]|uniref:Uncharacterized protein n=1 Tax=Blepharisma stoltei TaxID=1481888 RepID=A0AAU9JGU9_9CILI|nr:unnamed protein product [Blepharisma stoltei]
MIILILDKCMKLVVNSKTAVLNLVLFYLTKSIKNMGVCVVKQSAKTNLAIAVTDANDSVEVQEQRRRLLIVKAKRAPSLKLDQNALYNRRRVSHEITGLELSQISALK